MRHPDGSRGQSDEPGPMGQRRTAAEQGSTWVVARIDPLYVERPMTAMVAPCAGPEMSTSSTMLSPVLVGRDGHLEVAEMRLADAAAGHGRTLLVAGEAGIGKTRYIGAVLRRARALGFTVVKGDIGPQDQQLPGALVLDLARTMPWSRSW